MANRNDNSWRAPAMKALQEEEVNEYKCDCEQGNYSTVGPQGHGVLSANNPAIKRMQDKNQELLKKIKNGQKVDMREWYNY